MNIQPNHFTKKIDVRVSVYFTAIVIRRLLCCVYAQEAYEQQKMEHHWSLTYLLIW